MLPGEQVSAEIAVNTPFQVVRPTQNHTSMMPIPEALSRLSQHDQSIAVISVVGPYHSGKSFLLNALVGNTQVFSVGRKTSPETMGIWLCRTELKARDGSEVWLLDSEGFFGPGVAESYDAKIFTVATLLGAHLVYNTVKIIDQQAVSLLEMLARRAQLFRTRSAADASQVETPEFLSVRSFPPLTWVVEDFVQELPSGYRVKDGATAWLKSYLSTVNSTKDPDGEGGDEHFLTRLYSDLKVHTLFLPATTKEGLQDLSRLKWDELTTEFKEELAVLRSHILSKLEARRFEGRAMTGRTLERTLRFTVQALQRGKFHELPSLWATWTTQVAEMSLQDADKWFADLLTAIDAGDDPVPVAQMNAESEEARRRSVLFYRELLHDFEVRPDITALERRMAVHFQQKLTLYHERIHRWANELIKQAKSSMSGTLAHVELPVDPDVLKTTGENSSKVLIKDFAALLQNFAMRGKGVKHGKEAGMPVFSQDPVEQMTTDLRALQSMRELDNQHEIGQYFKAAVAAADEVVDKEVKANSNRLLGKARMKELQQLLSVKCWQAFDEPLRKHKWMLLLSNYRTHKALVQTETYEARLQRFQMDNEQKLNAHFRTALSRCLTGYDTKKANLAMPVSESELEAEHKQLADFIREQLVVDDTGRDLMDTDVYKSILRSLDEKLEEGYQFLRQKNVELWKVHSDDATRCALKANQAVDRKCGFMCLFNKVPQIHKKTSRKHLLECFPKSGTGSRMSTRMQEQVFEDWYNKDLASDASIVWNNFYIGSSLIGIFMILVWTSCMKRPAPQVPPPVAGTYYQQPPMRTGYSQFR